MPLLIQNNSKGPTVFSDTDDNVIEWQGLGDPGGEDVQSVPDDVASSSPFMAALRRRIFTVIEDSSTSDALKAGAAQNRIDAEASALDGVLTPDSKENDLIVVKCLISSKDVTMKASDLHKVPPLSDEYAFQASSYTAVSTGEMTESGVPVVVWTQAQGSTK